jgi:2-polyprenyl-3-methyl-5-hydroxy-6-metoxy-1,4-benzoquinol methylase
MEEGEGPAVAAQADFWNRWNREVREHRPPDAPTLRRQQEVLEALARAGVRGGRLLEVGCGTGWLAARLQELGDVTATDLADEVIARARAAHPGVRFLAGDFMTLEAGAGYDVVVCLETLSHFVDQSAFVARLASCLRAGGRLLLTTQNRSVFERRDDVTPRAPGQIRNWVDARQLRALLTPHFRIVRLTSLLPEGHRGILRVLNSPRLNAPFAALLGRDRVRRWKEAAHLGQTLFVEAEKRCLESAPIA